MKTQDQIDEARTAVVNALKTPGLSREQVALLGDPRRKQVIDE